MRIWFPTRRRPGDKDVPADVPQDVNMFNLNDRDLEEGRFIDDKRISFLWDRTSNYFVDRDDGLELLLDHLPNQLLNVDHHRYGSFLSYLRHSSVFTERFAECMMHVGSLDSGLGALKLLQELIIAEHGLGYKFDPTHGKRWKEMHALIRVFPAFLQRIMSYCSGPHTVDDFRVLLALSELRGTLIRARFQSLQKMTHRDWAHNVHFLNEMMLCLEGLDGFALLPIYADSLRISDSPVLPSCDVDQADSEDRRQNWRDSKDLVWGYELLLENSLTFLADGIRLGKIEQPENSHFEMLMTSWRDLSSEKDLETFSKSSRLRQPSGQVLSLLCSRGCGYGQVLDQLLNLFTIPNPPQLFRLEVEHDRPSQLEVRHRIPARPPNIQ